MEVVPVATAPTAQVVPDIFYIPSAPGGIWKEKGRYLRWLTFSARNLALKTMKGTMFPGYTLFGGEGKEKTMALIEELGLNSSYYNSTHDRIMVGDGPQGCVLAYISLEEREQRLADRKREQAERSAGVEDAYMSAIDRKGIRPVVYETEDDYTDRKRHATRESTNRVGYTGARR